MSALRKIISGAVVATAVSAGTMGLAGTTPKASAETVTCMPAKANIHCSMYWANRTTTSAVLNARGTTVTNLQRALVQVGLKIPVTGVYDHATLIAVRDYQYSRKLSGTGRLDATTLSYMRAGAGVYKMIARLRPPAPTVTKADLAVKFAYAQLGKPYRYGATGPSSFDCSGLTQASYRSAGVSIGRTTGAQLGSLRSVSRSALKPGDIVGYYGGGHVSIYVGNGYVIHAPRTGDVVKKVPMSQMPFYKAVRVVG